MPTGNMQNSNMTNVPMVSGNMQNSNMPTGNRLHGNMQNSNMPTGNMQNSNIPNYGNDHNKSMNNEYPMNSTSNISSMPLGAYNQNHQAYNNNMNTMNNMTPMSVNTSYHANNAPRSGAGSVNSPMPENNYSPNLQQRQLQQRQLQQQYSQQQYPQQMSGQSQQHLQSPPRYANGNKQSGTMPPGTMLPGNKQPGNRSAYPTNNGTDHSVPLDPNTNNMYFSSSSQTPPNPQYIPQVGANMNNRVPNGPYPPRSVFRMENPNKQMLNPPPSKTLHKNTDNTSVISASSAKKRGSSRTGLVSPNDLYMPKEENGTQPMNRAEKRHVKEEIEDRPVCGSEVQYNEQNLYQNTKSGMNTSFYLIF